jgi:hypothetical protein
MKNEKYEFKMLERFRGINAPVISQFIQTEYYAYLYKYYFSDAIPEVANFFGILTLAPIFRSPRPRPGHSSP